VDKNRNESNGGGYVPRKQPKQVKGVVFNEVFSERLFSFVLIGIISLSFSPFVISTNAEGTDWTEYANNPVFDPDAKAYYPSVI
jgi:hypothetical protein